MITMFGEAIALLNTPSYQLLDIAKEIKVLKMVIAAYFNYNYP